VGASKWNPIEHRLFSEVSRNWPGEPLDSYHKILNYARTTQTQTGFALLLISTAGTMLVASNLLPIKLLHFAYNAMNLRPSGTTPFGLNCSVIVARSLRPEPRYPGFNVL